MVRVSSYKRSKRSRAQRLRYKKLEGSIRKTNVIFAPIETTDNKYEEQMTSQCCSHHTVATSSDSKIDREDEQFFVGNHKEEEESDLEKCIAKNPNWGLRKYEAHIFLAKQSKNIGVIKNNEFVDISSHEIEREKVPKQPSPIEGNRIVELGYLLDRVLKLQYDHCQSCTLGRLITKSESRKASGLVSTILLQCEQCCKEFKISTENPKYSVSQINTGAVWGTLATGSTYSHLEELLSCMNIPTIPDNMFYKMENELGKEWKWSLIHSMNEAGKKEKEFAIAQNHLCLDGTPWITVYVDGSWSKRSYGNNYNSLSGMVGIIGRHTGQLLFIAVRNKFCSVCSKAEQNNEHPKQHVCYKNWNDSAPSMESDMVVEGFNCSEEMHGVRYCKFIADGDSSVFAKIRGNVQYGAFVKKVECTNHAIKNYGKHLFKIKADLQINKEGRKLLTKDKIKKLTKRAKCSIYEHSKNDQNVDNLKEDLRNGVLHVFGDHSKYTASICNNIGDMSLNNVPNLKKHLIYDHLIGALNLLVRKAHLLIENETNNRAERLMNIVSRFNMGKRLNLVQRGSYERRVHLAGLRYNHSFKWHSSAWKKTTGNSPGKYLEEFMKKYEQKTKKANARHSGCKEKKNTQKIANNVHTEVNRDYGKYAEQPSDDEETVNTESELLLQRLQISTEEERQKIQTSTVGQFDNTLYEYHRKHRLTASLFGRIINRRPYTPCHNIVKECLKVNRNILTEAMQFGICKENVAIELFKKAMAAKGTILNVDNSGLWVDLQYGFLGASPDGLVREENAIIEVKCLYSACKAEVSSIQEAIALKKAPFLENNNETISLKLSHNYYYQVQGQLNVTQKEKCYFVVYISDTVDIFYTEVFRDETLWNNTMLPKLIQFYKECIAPEIIRGNIMKNKKCKDPPFITKEIELHQTKTKKRHNVSDNYRYQ